MITLDELRALQKGQRVCVYVADIERALPESRGQGFECTVDHVSPERPGEFDGVWMLWATRGLPAEAVLLLPSGKSVSEVTYGFHDWLIERVEVVE